MKPFCNLTSFYFSISPSEYYNNLMSEIYGCLKYVGMSYDMIMKLPIQDRRIMIRKHNLEQEEINKELDDVRGGDTRTYEGESINVFAEMEQNNQRKRGY